MCVFCGTETEKEETNKSNIEYCGNCKSKVAIFKKDSAVLASKFPKRDKVRALMLYAPFFLIALFLLYDGSEVEIFAKIPLIGFILFAALMILLSILNFRNLKTHGYIYLGINRVIKKNDIKFLLRASKITTMAIILLGLYVIVRMCMII